MANGSPQRVTVVNPFDDDDNGVSTHTANIIDITRYASGRGTPSSPLVGFDGIVIGRPANGTISVSHSASSAVVTGVGTQFLAVAEVGKYLCYVTSSGVAAGRIESITNNLSLTVETWNGPTVSGVAFRIYEPVTLYAPGAFYAFSTEWHIGFPMLTLRGDGAATRFVHSGVGKGISARGNYTAGAIGSPCIDLRDFSFIGGADTTDAITYQNLHFISGSNIYVHNATNAGLTVNNVVLGELRNMKYSGQFELPTLPTPTYGWYLNTAFKVDLYACSGENAARGAYLIGGKDNTWHGGTLEANSAYGMYIEATAQKTVVDNVDFEGNTTADVFIKGAAWTTLRDIDSNGLVHLSTDAGLGAFSTRCTLIGGEYTNLTVDAGCDGNVFQGFTYGGTITNNSGGGNTWVGVRARVALDYYLGGLAGTGELTMKNATAKKPGLVTQSGFGGSPTIVIEDGSSSSSITVTVTAGTVPGTTGTLALAFVPALAAGSVYAVVPSFADGTGTWDIDATGKFTAQSNTGFTFTWSNNGVALVQGSTYKFHFILIGH